LKKSLNIQNIEDQVISKNKIEDIENELKEWENKVTSIENEHKSLLLSGKEMSTDLIKIQQTIIEIENKQQEVLNEENYTKAAEYGEEINKLIKKKEEIEKSTYKYLESIINLYDKKYKVYTDMITKRENDIESLKTIEQELNLNFKNFEMDF